MKIAGVSHLLPPQGSQSPGNTGAADKEIKEASKDFAALLYEQMLKNMVRANMGTQSMEEGLWWEMLTQEISREIVRSPGSPLAEQLYAQLKPK